MNIRIYGDNSKWNGIQYINFYQNKIALCQFKICLLNFNLIDSIDSIFKLL